MQRTQSYIFVVLFLLAISVPSILLLSRDLTIISVEEKRRLESMPKLDFTAESIVNYPNAFEAFFNDHFGLRTQLSRLYSYSLAKILHTSPKWFVTVGKDDWLYLADHSVLGNFAGARPHPARTYRHWKQILQDRTHWLQQFDTDYLFSIVPDKMMVYPEHLPGHMTRLARTNNVDDFFNLMNAEPVAGSVFDMRPTLMEGKTQGLVYYKTDTHWNHRGALLTYHAIMTRLSERHTGLKPYPLEAFRHSVQPSPGLGNAGLFNLSDAYQDMHEFHDLPAGMAKPQWERHPFPTETGPDGRPMRTGNLFVTENKEKTGSAIFLSDSFGNAIRDYLAIHFGRMLHITKAHMEDITELIRREKPDVIIDITVARDYHVALGEHREMASDVIKQQFDESAPLLDLSPRTPELIVQAEELDWTNTPEGIEIVSRGKDPKLFLSTTNWAEAESGSRGVVNLRCSMTSSIETTFALYFLSGEHDEFSPRRMATQKIYPGKNDFVLRIYEPIRLDNIRVDPGVGNGTFQLHRLTIANSKDV